MLGDLTFTIDYFVPESLQEPVEPPEGEFENNTSAAPETPTAPQTPTDSDVAPPADSPTYRSHRASKTVTTSTDTSRPESQANSTPTQTKPPLICNGAVIDVFQTFILQGYGDGLLHEDDPLTRAQLSTILYRLLDADTIALYNGTGSNFIDVPADAWYLPYVQTISNAGIVSGIGGGRYTPDDLVSWAQIISILSRFVEPQDYTLQYIQCSEWATQAIQIAVALGWIGDSADFVPDAVIRRGELVRLVNGVLAQCK